MGFRINSNIEALNTNRNLGINSANFSKSLQRLSSGLRINSAKDDAAGMAISNSFTADTSSATVAQRNISEANSLLQTADGAISSVKKILVRMKELATQASSANAGSNIDKISDEYDTLVDEIDRIAGSTKYAGTNLTDGTFSAGNTSATWATVDNTYDVNVGNATAATYAVTYSATTNKMTISDGTKSEVQTLADGAHTVNFSSLGISFKTTTDFNADTSGALMDTANLTVAAGADAAFQIGYEKDPNSILTVQLDSILASDLGVAAGDINSAANAYNALATIDQAVNTLSSSAAKIGAYQNRLQYASENLAVTIENFTAANSTISEVDMASEMTTFTKNQILIQAGTAMLAQANQAPQNVLSLLK